MLVDQDIIRITDKQIASSKAFVNLYFYRVSVSVPGITLLNVASAFRLIVTAKIRALQVAACTHEEFVIENLTNAIDIDTQISVQAGLDTNGGPVQPTYLAASYRLNVSDKTTRPGGKRISGIGEERVASNNYVPDETANDEAEAALAEQFGVVGVPVGDGVAIPIVVGRDILGALDLDRVSVISSASAAFFIKTQVSRRRAG
jgi:hypothetical protein